MPADRRAPARQRADPRPDSSPLLARRCAGRQAGRAHRTRNWVKVEMMGWPRYSIGVYSTCIGLMHCTIGTLLTMMQSLTAQAAAQPAPAGCTPHAANPASGPHSLPPSPTHGRCVPAGL